MASRSHKTKKLAPLHTSVHQYTAIFDPDPHGGYTVTVPVLPGLVTEGDTFEEAQRMAEDAIRCHIEALRKLGEKVPTEDIPIVAARVAVSSRR